MDKALYGIRQDGTKVHVFTLRNAHGMSASVLDMGGTITAINVPDRGGKARNVVLGLKDLAAYEAGAWFNCLIGRYANRIRGGVTVAGKHYALPADANGVTLHSGRALSYGTRMWTVVKAEAASLTLTLVSPDGDQGFPGALNIDVTYSVTDDNALRLDYRAITDALTFVNLTNHLYFNLAGHGSVEHQRLRIFADHITPTDAQQIPTGAVTAVAGTAFDFRAPMAIGARLRSGEPQMLLARGYDHNFVLRKRAPGAFDPAVSLHDPESGILLELSTTEPGVQVYSTNNVNGGLVNSAGNTIRQSDGLALETQHFPDSPNKPNFPSTQLNPGEIFRSTTEFRFSQHG
jgi:aldose 1-epimerase